MYTTESLPNTLLSRNNFLKSEQVSEEINQNLRHKAEHTISTLSLASVKMRDFLVIMRPDFDLKISGEPYIAFMLLLNLRSGKYISRVWNQTLTTGSALEGDVLLEACKTLFCQGRPCYGYPVSETPFPRSVATTCSRVLDKDVAPDVTACQDCSRLKTLCSVSNGLTTMEEPDGNAGGKADTADSLTDSINVGDFMEVDNTADQNETYVTEGFKECSSCGASYNLEEHEQHALVGCGNAIGTKNLVDGKEEGSLLDDTNKEKKCYTKKRVRERKTCNICTKTFSHGQYYDHMKIKHFHGNFSCIQCGTKANYASELVQHMNEFVHTQDPFVVCPSCETKVQIDTIQLHYENCIKNKGEICPICGKKIVGRKRAERLTEHMKFHMRQQGLSDEEANTTLYYYCDKCGKKCTSKEKLRTHQKNMHSEGQVPCPICGKEFAYNDLMKRHKRKEHHPFKCKHCAYTTPDNHYLKKHMRKHFDPTFKCGYCEKMLKSEKSLEAHEREHTGERPFRCPVCEKGFTAVSALTTHKKHVHKILTPGMKPIVKRVRKN